jgi:succinoglycan biosynthesis protein ExoO
VPKVSVIIPAFNAEGTIVDALVSVQEQSHHNLEILVVDDCSTDKTKEIVQSFMVKDQRIKLLSTSFNIGPSGARNIALDVATGMWVTLIDADDLWTSNRVSSLLIYAKLEKVDCVIDNLMTLDHSSNKIHGLSCFSGKNKPAILTPENLFIFDNPFLNEEPTIGYCKPFINVDFIRRNYICYDHRYRFHEDFIFLADIVLIGGKVIILPVAFYIYRLKISPTTGEESPFSHTTFNLQSLFQASNEILVKYRNKLSKKALRTLLFRNKLFLINSHFQEQKKLLINCSLLSVMKLLCKEPFYIIIKLLYLRRIIVKKLRVKF